MTDEQERRDSSQLAERKVHEPLQEMLFIAEAATRVGLAVVPGERWGLHYPQDGAQRNEKLQGLLEGRYEPATVAAELRPDALVYALEDIKTQGVEAVTARIIETSMYQQQFDYVRFAEFVAGMKGKNIPLETLQQVYDSVARSRVQKRIYDAFSSSGQSSMKISVQAEVAETNAHWTELSPSERVLSALKQHWLAEDMQIVDPRSRDLAAQLLSPEERVLFDQMKESYRKYIQNGDESGYRELVKHISDQFPGVIPQHNPTEVMSPEMEKLQEELEPFQDQVGPPGSERDPAIPPEDQDEYHTHKPDIGGGKEQQQRTFFYQVTPPLGGYYIAGRKSYYDIDRKVWSKKKQLVPYTSGLAFGKDRHSISGTLDTSLKALPLPKTYALDVHSLTTNNGAAINFFRDQNGCFYLQASNACTFTVDFQREAQLVIESTSPEDLKPLYRGQLSTDTENTLQLLQGSDMQKAKQIRAYIHTHHSYPGGGDLRAAQALQYKLRQESTGDNYLQHIDSSEYLECYSANTLFCALLRKVGIPARLVTGDKVEGAKNGVSVIDSTTGHAWSEVWDGHQWVRFDATPAAKPEDTKKHQPEDEQQSPAPEADDGAADKVPPTQQDSQNQQKMEEASDSALQEGQKQMDEARQQVETMEQKNQELQEKIAEANTFEELQNVQKELEKEDLLETMKDSLEDRIEARKEQLQDEMEEILEQMTDDGFMDEERKQEIEDQMEGASPAELEKIRKQIEHERGLFDAYEALKEAVDPFVEEWWKYFAERLPKDETVDFDEDSLSRSGAFNKRAVQRFRNLMFGQVKNPRMTIDSTKPRFIAKILIDTSGSMSGEKLNQAQLLLVFYNELFSRISKEYGYIRYSNDTFSDTITEIKGFDQEYDSPKRYDFPDGTSSTIKVRLMRAIKATGGTNMLTAVRKAGTELNAQVSDYPDYASALYFIGDGEDTSGNTERIKQYLESTEAETGGFGQHMKSAIMLGNENQRQALAKVFGDDATRVADTLETLIEESMYKFEEDITGYLENLQ